jgi:hypothetical protein
MDANLVGAQAQPSGAGLPPPDDVGSEAGGHERRRLASRLWPAVALVLLLGVTVQGAWAGHLSRVPGPIVIALMMGAAAAGWTLVWSLELSRLPVVTSVVRPAPEAGGPATGRPILARAVLAIAILAILAALLWLLSGLSSIGWRGVLRLGLPLGALFTAGAAGRLWLRSHLVVEQLVVAATLSAWAYYDALKLPSLPMRDLKLYLGAGGAWLDGRAVYLTSPLTREPSDPTLLPFVYPPFLLPLFGALDRLPLPVVIVIWEVAAIAAVILSLKILGVRTRWLPLLMLWPPIALGLSVGNAAPFGFLGLAAGWRWGPALVLGGMFKAQAAIPSLWLLRERRWRPFLLGCALVAGLILVTLPLTGVAIYGDWLRGLQAFEATLRRFPQIQGFALQHSVPPEVAIALAVLAVVAAMAASGRLGLARFGLASIVASPTIYVHGLTFILPAALWLDTATLWTILGLVTTQSGAWLAIGAAGVAVMFGVVRRAMRHSSSRAESSLPDAAGPSLHLLGSGREPWP